MPTQDESDRPRPTVDLGYPTPAHGKIPAFNSIEEEAEFWDTHSFVDYLDDFEPLNVTPATPPSSPGNIVQTPYQ